jgi:glycosyltransferase involved in cell wall biosynthesis
LRIMWHSNSPFAATGYGVQTALFTPRIVKAGHDVAISAFWGLLGATIDWRDGIVIFPGGMAPYGQDIWGQHADAFNADVIISLVDAWVLDGNSGKPWAPWFPVDHYPVPPPVLHAVAQSQVPIAMSRFGQNALQEAGVDAAYVPHGYDPAVYHPDPAARDEARKWLGAEPDQHVFGIVAANKGGFPSRKSIPQMIEAFALVANEDEKAFLYIHSHLGPELQGANLGEIIVRLGLQERVKVVDQYRNTSGMLSPGWLNGIYNAFDTLINVSMGEGFGVPILEAQAVGCPVIVGAWTAMQELCFGGWMLHPELEADRVWTPQGSYMWLPRIEPIAEAMRQAMVLRADDEAWHDLRSRCIAGAAAYQADLVMERFWLPVLERIEDTITVKQRISQIRVEEPVA